MKKYLLLPLLSILTFCTCSTIAAQGLRFGLKGGAGFSNLHFSEPEPDTFDQSYYAEIWYEQKSAYHPTFLLGGVLEYDLTKDFLLSTGLNVTAKFARVKTVYPGFYENDFRLRLLYLQLPVNVHYRTGRVFIGAGGYLGLCASGKWKIREVYQNPDGPITYNAREKVAFGNDPEIANLKRFDAGVRGEIGYGFKTVRLSLAYDHGLINNLPTGENGNGGSYDGKLRHQAIYATVTYYWLANQ